MYTWHPNRHNTTFISAKAYKLYIETGKKEASVLGPRRVARSADQLAPGYDIYAAHDSGFKPKAYRIGYDLSMGAQQQRRHLRNFDFSGSDEDVIRKAQEELVDGDEGLDEHLDSEAGWNTWREGFKNMDDFGNYQFAAYMHCKLR
eukprot:sb/3473869/